MVSASSPSDNNNGNSPTKEQLNEAANNWHTDIGVPTIPGKFKSKLPAVLWEGYQTNPPAEEEFRKWLSENKFQGGIFILCGKVCYRKDRENLFLVGIDIDTQKGIDAFCTGNEKLKTLQDYSNITLVEQHDDMPDRCHIFFYSPFKFPVKRPDSILGIEIKSAWEHGLMRVTPSVTESGYPLRIIGTAKEPRILTEDEAIRLLQHINNVCIDNGIEYVQKGTDVNSSKYLTPELKTIIKERNVSFGDKQPVIIPHGYRNVTLISVANSILFNHLDKDRTNEDKLKQFFFAINVFCCKPEPLPDKEVQAIWNSAIKWAWPKILNDILRGTRRKTKEEQKQEEEKEEEDFQEKVLELTSAWQEKYHFKTLKGSGNSYKNDDIWYYDEQTGNFVQDAEALIAHKLKSEFGIKISSGQIDEIVHHIRYENNYFDRSKFNPYKEWLATKDCMINLKTGESMPFSPDYLNTNYIPVQYRNSYGTGAVADFFRMVERTYHSDYSSYACPKLMQFLYDVIIIEEDVQYALDFIAYCLWREYRYAEILLAVGYGQNGKSVFLNVVNRLLGNHNVAGESLYRIEHEKFAIASLFNKLANIDADISVDTVIENTGIIKKLTGNDILTGEFKFKTPFPFVNHAKLMYSCNEIPETVDTTDAIWRRIKIIRFPRQFFDDENDPHILEKLCTEDELSGLLFEILQRMPKVIDRGLRPTSQETMKETYERYLTSKDPVQLFIDKAIARDIGCKVSVQQMYESYIMFCRQYDIIIWSQESFSRKFAKKGYEKSQIKVNGVKNYYWIGVKLVDWKAIEDTEQSRLGDFKPGPGPGPGEAGE